MDENKYKKILTIVLIILVIAVILVVGFVVFDIYRKHSIDNDAEKFIDEYENKVQNDNDVIQSGINVSEDNSIDGANTVIPDLEPTNTNNNGSSSSTKRYTYKGYNVIGTIEIPKTKIKYPILERDSKGALEVAVAYAYGAMPNQIGNMTIAGHNYRNGAFFGKNKQLSNGDIVYITDNSGLKVKYTIYNIYIGTPEESDFMIRDTNGKREISLITCTDDSKSRLIIWAKED